MTYEENCMKLHEFNELQGRLGNNKHEIIICGNKNYSVDNVLDKFLKKCIDDYVHFLRNKKLETEYFFRIDTYRTFLMETKVDDSNVDDVLMLLRMLKNFETTLKLGKYVTKPLFDDIDKALLRVVEITNRSIPILSDGEFLYKCETVLSKLDKLIKSCEFDMLDEDSFIRSQQRPALVQDKLAIEDGMKCVKLGIPYYKAILDNKILNKYIF